MTKVSNKVFAVIGASALLSMSLLTGCGSGATSASGTSSGSNASVAAQDVSARVLDAEIQLKKDVSTEQANTYVEAIKKIEGVVDAEFKPATEKANACIQYSFTQGTSTIAIEDMLMEMDGFADVYLPKKITNTSDEGTDSADSSSASAEDAEASSSAASADASDSASSEAASPEQENVGDSEGASQE